MGDTIKIRGKNFSTKKDENRVAIGNSIMQIINATDTIVRGFIPFNLDSISAKISISVLGNIAFAENPFILLPPEIHSFTPATGTPAGSVEIYGKNFLYGKTNVYFGSIAAQIINITNDYIKFITPTGNPEGPVQISVKVLSQTAISKENDKGFAMYSINAGLFFRFFHNKRYFY